MGGKNGCGPKSYFESFHKINSPLFSSGKLPLYFKTILGGSLHYLYAYCVCTCVPVSCACTCMLHAHLCLSRKGDSQALVDICCMFLVQRGCCESEPYPDPTVRLNHSPLNGSTPQFTDPLRAPGPGTSARQTLHQSLRTGSQPRTPSSSQLCLRFAN